MNRASLLLLVTLVQSQSDGVLLFGADDTSDNFEDGFQNFQLEGWDSSEGPFPVESIPYYGQGSEPSKRSTSDSFTRRSALDKNFMRFGRASKTSLHQFCGRPRGGTSDGKPSFFRFGRGLKDNFIRFGRGGKDSFIRFGRSHPEDFSRAGKSMRDNFIRFGKADRNFMRFGRETDEELLYPESLEWDFGSGGKSSGASEDFERSRKSGNQKEGKNGTNFLRFGREGAEEKENDGLEEGSKQGERERRAAEKKKEEKSTSERTVKENGREGNQSETARLYKRSTGYFEQPPENFPRRFSPVVVSNYWQSLENLKNSRLTPFFPVGSNFPTSSILSGMDSVISSKRNGGAGSNFIRFG